MKAGPICKDCLKDLARRVVALSGGDGRLTASALDLVDTLCNVYRIPTEVSKRILRYVREETGVYDPYAERKEAEFRAGPGRHAAAERLFPRYAGGRAARLCLRQRRGFLHGAFIRRGPYGVRGRSG